MQVLVTGGTGTLGREVVRRLRDRGHDVRVLTRRPAPDDRWAVTGDLATGAGLAAAVAGVDVVIDAANAASPKKAEDVLVGGTRRLGIAAAAAGVSHHLLISIVGIEDVPMPYYRVKLRQEAALADGAVGWTLLRATQFHPLLDHAFSALARLPVLPMPDFPVQPIDPGEVADSLVSLAESPPAGRVPDVAGPEVLSAVTAARQWCQARGRRRPVMQVPLPGRIGAGLRSGALTSPEHATGTVRFEDWLRIEADRRR